MQYIDFCERLLFKVVILSIVILSLVQATKDNSSNSLVKNIDTTLVIEERGVVVGEEVRPAVSGVSDQSVVLSLKLLNYSSLAKAKILINGQERADFITKEVTLHVNPGDLISVDTSAYSQVVSIKVNYTDPTVVLPKEDTVYSVRGDVLNLPQVKTDN